MENDQYVSVLASVSKISEHCFKICDLNLQAARVGQDMRGCIKGCVKQVFETKNYVSDRWGKEVPAAKRLNRSLEFASLNDLT